MSTYEEEHNIQDRATAADSTRTNTTGQPRQTLQRLLDAFLAAPAHAPFTTDSILNPQMLSMLQTAISTDKETGDNGVQESFLDSLDRVPAKSLTKDDSCPICTNEYLSDEYPLVVELPCPGKHRFDLECIAPWLRANRTCPLCRADVTEKKEILVIDDDEEEEEEEEQWEMYG